MNRKTGDASPYSPRGYTTKVTLCKPNYGERRHNSMFATVLTVRNYEWVSNTFLTYLLPRGASIAAVQWLVYS